jgi:hypothetical protein
MNPKVRGRISTTFNSKNAGGAAQKCWNTLSNCFGGNLPKFAFTLQDGGGKFYHFAVEEVLDNNGNVDFDIKQINGSDTKLKNHIRSMKQIKLRLAI